MGARYYVSWIARWIAVDPLEAKYTPESSYNYCHSNPVVWNDKTGMGPGDEEKPKITPAIVMVSGSSTQLNTTPAKQPSKPAPKPIPHNKQIDVPEDDPEALKPKPEPVKSPTDYVPETQYLIPDPQGHGHVWTASQIQKGIAARDEQTGNNVQNSFGGAMFYGAGRFVSKDVADKASDVGAALGQMSYGITIPRNFEPGKHAEPLIENSQAYTEGSNIKPSTVYRVQGGTPPKASQTRITIGSSGEMQVAGSKMLYVNFNDPEHATYFSSLRPGSEIISFKVSTKFVQDVSDAAVPQAQGRSYPGSPQISDPTKSSSAFGLPETWIEQMINSSQVGSGKITIPYRQN